MSELSPQAVPPQQDETAELKRTVKKLEVRYSQLKNDLFLTRKENEENAGKYIELLDEFKSKNEELQKLKDNLESLVADKTAELRRNTEELRRRDHLLVAASQVGTVLLSGMVDFSEALSQALRLSGEAAELDRVCILEYLPPSPSATETLSLNYEWTSERARYFSAPKTKSAEDELSRWCGILSGGAHINGHISDFSDKEKAFLESRGVLSILVAPIFLQGRFWGGIAFEECRSMRQWTESEINILATVGGLIGSAIMRHRAEDELEKARLSAEHAAAEAKAATRAKSEFLSNMSHEIRTPLNGVVGMIEILGKTKLDDFQRGLTDDLSFSAESLLQIINDILDFSKIEAGMLVLDCIPCNLFDIFEKPCRAIRHQALKKGIELIFDFPEDCPRYVMGDPVRLRQIVLNFLGNAVKFTESGRIALSVRCTGDKEGEGSFTVSVSDTGIGIPEDKLEMIFDKFTQINDASTRKASGTGLGLAISKQLVEKMNGRIKVKSRLGEGSIFSFRVPLRFAEKGLVAVEEERNIAWKRPPEVLLAEDSRVNQAIAMNFLQAAGCQVELVENGLDAIRKATRHRFDIILMDIQMPKVDGLEAAITIHEEERNAQVPIIAVTANAVESERKKYIDSGMQDCLFKPYREKDMRKILAKHLPDLLLNAAESASFASSAGKNASQKSTASEQPVCDSVAAIDRLNGDIALYKRTVSILFEEWPVLYSEFERASRAADFELAGRMAHSIKGASAYVGGERLSSRAREAEFAAKSKDQKLLEDFIPRFSAEFAALKKALAPYSS